MNYLHRRYEMFMKWRYPLGYINIKNIKNQQIHIFMKKKHEYVNKLFMQNRKLHVIDKLINQSIIDLTKNTSIINRTNKLSYQIDNDNASDTDIDKKVYRNTTYRNIYNIPKDFSHASDEYGIFYTIIFYSNCANKWLLKFGIIEKRCINNRFKEHVYKYNIIKQKDYPLIIIMLLAKYPNVKMLEDKVKKILKIDRVIGITGISHNEQTYNLKDIKKIREIVLTDKYILDILNFDNFKISANNDIIKED